MLCLFIDYWYSCFFHSEKFKGKIVWGKCHGENCHGENCHGENCHGENWMVKTVWGKLHGDKIQGERFSVVKTVWGKLTMGITVKVKTVGWKLHGENVYGDSLTESFLEGGFASTLIWMANFLHCSNFLLVFFAWFAICMIMSLWGFIPHLIDFSYITLWYESRALSESLPDLLPKTRTEQHVVLAIKGVCRHDQKSSNGATQWWSKSWC